MYFGPREPEIVANDRSYSRGSLGGSLHGGASFEVEKADFAT